MWHRCWMKTFFILCVMFVFFLSAGVRASEKNKHTVKDLSYGVSLFHFYQEKYFSAITDLLVAENKSLIKNDKNNPALLLGGLYLSYDLHKQSSNVFQSLLEAEDVEVPSTILDQARFLLGKNYYYDGYYSMAEEQFKAISDGLPVSSDDEKLFLLNAIFLQNDDFEQAQKALDLFPSSSAWKGYAEFNTASWLIQKSEEESRASGFELMKDLGDSDSLNAEKLILKDKANLALAYVALRDGESKQSIEYFNKIRLNGVETNKALLGIGWANYRENKFKESVIPWMHLASSQTESDLAVQEAFISIPYAFEKMKLRDQALHHYGLAVDSYKFQLEETQQLLDFIKTDEFIKQLNPGSLGKETTSAVKIIKNLNPLLTQYLLPFLSSIEFQREAKHYLELNHLRYMINHWKNNIPALQMMLKEKRKTYKNKLSKTMDDESIDKARVLTKRSKKLSAQVAQIESKEKALALSTPKETGYLQLLSEVSKRISALEGDDEELLELKRKFRLLKGRIQWEIEIDYPVRIWNIKKELKKLNTAVAEMNKSMGSLQASWKNAPAEFSGFDKRISNKDEHIKSLKNRIDLAVISQEKLLRRMTLEKLRLHRNQIKLYHDRALFAKARLYDSLMERK